ncbi:DUF2218 domain-containing protein [Rhodobacteraceae bacterium NNCM2]|nr:DUF2218 domain-containing protein [Coraliihabitans acroporae]
MNTSTATISSTRASGYLQQLCKHFGHKIPVEYTESDGRIELPFGTCRLKASDNVLTMTVEGAPDDIARLEKVIGDHLARFAFRENPSIEWHENA